MDDIKAIATGILSTNHWPAHLGLTTDAERIEWLAKGVEELAETVAISDGEAEKLSADLERANENITDRDEEIETLKDKIREIRGIVL